VKAFLTEWNTTWKIGRGPETMSWKEGSDHMYIREGKSDEGKKILTKLFKDIVFKRQQKER